MNTHREIAYRIDPALWMREVLGIAPRPWQEKFLCAPRGASMLALTARQVGKTTAAAVGMAHSASALGQEQTCAAHPRMSALHSLAGLIRAYSENTLFQFLETNHESELFDRQILFLR
ncbi:MAG: hypothetical protein ABWX81_10730 [Pseudolabrys sp.]